MIATDVGVNIQKDFLQGIEFADLITQFLDEVLLRLIIVVVVFVLVRRRGEEEAFQCDTLFVTIVVFDSDELLATTRTAFASIGKEIHVTTFLLKTECR